MSLRSKLVGLVLAMATVAGCKEAPTPAPPVETKPAAAAVPERSVADVAVALKDKRVVAVDANGVETREKYGVVPGAVLLSSHHEFALSELPSDKAQPLVFYCGGTQCRASDTAAARAAGAGYAQVSVMREGIRGWVAAGQQVAASPKS
jgi:rhodanese-related sulfurtransferase